jgi:hypothetical protein
MIYREIDCLSRHDEVPREIIDTIEMPDGSANNLLPFIQ